MRRAFSSILLLGLSSFATAVFQDEVDDIDFHYSLFGVPQAETTFFHRPRRDDKASLLYTLGDVGVFGAVNPSNGEIVWRHQISTDTTIGGGHFRAPEDEDWVAAAHGSTVQAWNALTGRNSWHTSFAGQVKDLEILEVTETGRKDVLALFDEDGVTVLRRLHGKLGTVVWEFREHNKDIPLQVSTNIANIYVISLHGSPSSYSLKITSLDTLTGSRVNDWTVGTKGEVHGPQDVMFVGANSAAPLLAWTDSSLSKLSVHVLGTKGKQEIVLGAETTGVVIHAPHLTQSLPHFLVHTKTATGGKGEVYHTNLKNGQITRAFELPHLKGENAFSTSSEGANVYFTRITEDEILIVSSESPAVLQRWPLASSSDIKARHAVSEVIKKPGGEEFAIRSAVTTVSDDWTLVRNGKVDWSRPEGLSASVGAVWAELPETESLAKALEEEAHTNPLSAYIHRVNRHINDLKYLPAWLQSIPTRLIDSLSGETHRDTSLHRDSFGFNKVIVLATRRGRVYGLSTANAGKVIWSANVFPQLQGQSFELKGLVAKGGESSIVTLQGSKGEVADINAITGEVLRVVASGSNIESTATIQTKDGVWLLALDSSGKPVGEFPNGVVPKETIVVRGEGEVIKGVRFEAGADGATAQQTEVWQLQLLPGQRIVEVAVRPSHDPVASIGRVLGDRNVNYKYLNTNTIVVAVLSDEDSVLSIRLVDTVSGQILASQSYDGVDGSKDVSCVISENWYTCSFFGQYLLNDGSGQTIKGYQITSTDLYESSAPNDRGPLGDSENFSSLDPVDSPTKAPLPFVVSLGFVAIQPLTSLSVTQTRQGITGRQVLAYMPESHAIVGIPRQALDPRRPVGRDPTAAEQEAEGLMKYWPSLEIDPRSIVSHERDIIGISNIVAAPAIVESTTLVVAYGVDVFGTRVAPSGVFDILGKGFNKFTLILTVLALFGGVIFLAPMVSSSASFRYEFELIHLGCRYEEAKSIDSGGSNGIHPKKASI